MGFCRSEFCDGNDYSDSEESCMSNCGDVDLFEARKVCSGSDILPVAKIIRICNINSLEPLLTSGNDFKSIYILKDPRAIAENRSKMFTSWTDDQIVNSLKWTCLDTVKSLQTILVTQPDWAENKFLVLRAEDFFENKKNWIENVLNFSKLGQDDHVTNQLEETQKNQNENVDSWRNGQTLSYKVIKRIEGVCSEMMHLSGYKILEDEKMMQNFDIKLY